MIIAIHQPNFFPWMGFFDKIIKSNKFIFLTNSKRSKTDKYLTRTRILNAEKEKYLSIPLGRQEVQINKLKMPVSNAWKIKALNVVNAAYRRAYYYDEVYSDIEKLVMCEHESFSEYSMNAIKKIVAKLNINTKLYVDSDFKQDFGISNQRNLAICQQLGGEVYLSGSGAKIYNDSNLYIDNGLKLVYQDYQPPEYHQISSRFIPGLSIIDVLFNCGYEKVENMLKHP